MFERFTDRARKVMALAERIARRYNHEYIGSEHILFAVAEEGDGIGAVALSNLGASKKNIEQGFKKMIKPGPDILINLVSGNMVDKLPLTPMSKKVIGCAIEEARKLGHNYVETGHLLLGLLCRQKALDGKYRQTMAQKILRGLDVKIKDVRAEVMRLLGAGPSPLARKMITETKQLASIIEKKKEERSVKCKIFRTGVKAAVYGEAKPVFKFEPLPKKENLIAEKVEATITDFLSDGKELIQVLQSSVCFGMASAYIITYITIFYRDKGS